jgi:hypothetical protein
LWNAENEPDVAAPQDTTFNGSTFSYSPTGNQHSYEDAIWIKQYNGAVGNYISWMNTGIFENSPRWQFNQNDSDGDYVKKVCGYLP